MARKLLTILVSIGLVGVLAGVARSAGHEIEAGGEATFHWTPASGPVDHYVVQVATEAASPFSWRHFSTTAADELSVSISSDAFANKLPDVAHWAFDENSGNSVSDSTGNGHTGILSGPRRVADTRTGSGSALRFDGSNDSVQIGAVNVSGQALTIALWFKVDDFGVLDARLISKATGTAESDHYWMLSTVQSNGMKLRFRLKTNGRTSTLIASSGTLTPGVWTHAAIVYDGATMRIYQDGALVGSTSKTGSLTTSGSVKLAIGNQPSGAGSKPFDGIIDDVQIYSGALTQPEIATLAAGQASGTSFVTIRTIAYDSLGNASQPSAVSATVHFVPAIAWVYSVPDDFDGDAIPDVLTHDPATGEVVVELSSTGEQEQVSTITKMTGAWEIVAQGDFDGDLREDLLWRHRLTGNNRVWFKVGPDVVEEDFFNIPELARTDPAWKALASGDFDGDGFFDVFWQNEDTLETYVWFMEGPEVQIVDFPRLRSASWVVEASADFDGSGTYDLFWRDLDSGRTALWHIDGDKVEFDWLEDVDLGFEIALVLDFDHDGSTDLIWRGLYDSCEIWLMPQGQWFGGALCPPAE